MTLPESPDVLYGGAPHRDVSIDPLIINACFTGDISADQTIPHLPSNINDIVTDTAHVLIRKMRIEDTAPAIALLSQWNMAPVQASASIPEPERDHLELGNTFVAILQNELVGVASWLRIDTTHAETASLAVDRKFIGHGVGPKLQAARIAEMRSKGIVHVRTEADRPEVIKWYINKYGYRVVGTNQKKHPFSLPDQDRWAVLELLLYKD